MTRIFLRPSKTLIAATTLAVLLSVGCSKMPGISDAEANPTANSTQPTSTADDASAAPFAKRTATADVPTQKEATASKPSKESAAKLTTIPAGTSITVRLQSAVSSANSSAGDQFEAVLAEPIEVNGRVLAPAGASATGRVTAVNRSGRLEHPGFIQLALTSVEIEGRDVAVDTSTVSAKGTSHKKRNIAMIAGGAGGGALLGGLLGGGKGALIGSAVGAGAGTGTAYATGKKDVGFGVERHLTFRLRESIHVK